MSAESRITTNHNTIRKWVEERQGKPAYVKGTVGNSDPGMLRIDFPGYSGDNTLEPISWDEFFRKFDEKDLAFLYQEQTERGKESRFFKLIDKKDSDKHVARRG